MSFYPEALDIVANGKWLRSDGTYESTVWKDSNDTVAKDVIDAKVAELQAEYEANQYQRDRAVAYPSIADQLDKIYHSGIEGWKADIKAVKDEFPKPE